MSSVGISSKKQNECLNKKDYSELTQEEKQERVQRAEQVLKHMFLNLVVLVAPFQARSVTCLFS